MQKQQLSTFDQIWDYPVQWIDEPNQNRGGWSGVGCVEASYENKAVTLFVKKQMNHTTRTLLHPIQGVPTFVKEFHSIQFMRAHNLGVPNVVFFGQRQSNEGQQAILVTEMLVGYVPLDRIVKDTMSLLQQRELLRCIAKTIRHMHKLGVQHRALYAKHIFVNSHEASFKIAFIDLEKSRKMIFPPLQSLLDLITLNYRTHGWGRASRLFFLKQYLGQPYLSVWGRLLCRWVNYKTAQKHQQWNKKYERNFK